MPRLGLPWIAAVLILSLYGGSATARPADELVIGILSGGGTLQPNQSRGPTRFIVSMGHRRLAGPDETWRVKCLMCTTLPSVANGGAKVVALSNGQRGMEVTYRLQPGLAWADGVPVSSDDVIFSWQLGRTPGLGLHNTDIFHQITDITRLDAQRFTLHLDRVTYQFATPYYFEILPEHIEGPIFRGLADKGDYTARSAYVTAPTTPGLWDGPYALTSYAEQREAVFERNPFWPGPQVYFRRITIKPYADGDHLVQAMIAGEIDIFEETYLPPEQAHDLADHLGDAVEVKSLSTSRFLTLTLNLDRVPFRDRRVRQALLMAADRDEIIRTVIGDRRPPAHSFLNPRDPGYDPAPHRWAHDPDAARRLLAAAGYRIGDDGMFVGADGKPLGFELMRSSKTDLPGLFADGLMTQWRRFGIAVTDDLDLSMSGKRLPQRDFDAAIGSWSAVPEYPFEPMLLSSSIPSPVNDFTGYNYSGYANPVMDKLVSTLVAELDPMRRNAIWSEIQALYAEDLPSLPLFNVPSTYAVPRWLAGFVPTGHYMPSSSFAENWTRQ